MKWSVSTVAVEETKEKDLGWCWEQRLIAVMVEETLGARSRE
jgi:hypothetical protein